MKLLESKKFKLPKIFFVTDRSVIKELPIGVPFIYATPDMEKYLVKLLEYEILYKAAVKSGYPFNFKKILKENGFNDLKYFDFGGSTYMEFTTEKDYESIELKEFSKIDRDGNLFKEFIKDSAAYVNIEVLKGLNVFPIWLDDIEKAVSTNIHNFATFNNNMYNKKLEGMYGTIELSSPNKNLIIIDISGSIPKAVSTTCLTLAKNLTETFYADLIITGTISTFYPYEEIHKLDVKTAYQNGMNNDQAYFKKIVTETERHYECAIVFGDNDSPGGKWTEGDKYISDEEGKKLCKWKVNKLVSLHTKGTEHIAAYGRWFDVQKHNINKIGDWVTYLER